MLRATLLHRAMAALANACYLRTTWSSQWTLTYARGFMSKVLQIKLWNLVKQLYLLVEDLTTPLAITSKKIVRHVQVCTTMWSSANNLTASFNLGNVFPFSCTLVLLCGILFIFFCFCFCFFLFHSIKDMLYYNQ